MTARRVWAAAGCAVAALGYLTTTRWAQETARRTAERLSAPATAERPRQDSNLRPAA